MGSPLLACDMREAGLGPVRSLFLTPNLIAAEAGEIVEGLAQSSLSNVFLALVCSDTLWPL